MVLSSYMYNVQVLCDIIANWLEFPPCDTEIMGSSLPRSYHIVFENL